jgi:hypothetical protein
MATILEEYDQDIKEKRDKKFYRNKGKRKTTIKTLMGEVTYQRTVYQIQQGERKGDFVYLLDEQMGKDVMGLLSENLSEQIAQMVCSMSYHDTAKKISELTGQTISHGGVWNLIQKSGVKAEENEEAEKKKYASGQATGKREVGVLFEEADGVMLTMQGKDRKQGKTQEMKIAIFHEGWKKEGKNRYRLAHKQVVCGFENMADFGKRKEAKISSIYNTDEILVRIYNSDGAAGLKTIAPEEGICQLDPFHVKQAIIRATPHKRIQKEMMALYESSEAEKLLEVITTYANSMEKEEEEKKLRQLYGYLAKNQKELVPYQKRAISLPPAPEGIEYRAMGACEHNIYLASAQRMKHRGASWSKSGANHLGKLLALKTSGKFGELFKKGKEEEIVETVEENKPPILSSSKAPKTDGKGYEGRRCPCPFTNSMVTNGRKVIKNLFEIKSFSDLIYR